MGNVIESFSHGTNEQPIIDEVKKIAKRENRSQSQVIVLALEEYVKAHGKGNDTYQLEEFAKGAVALPTPWSNLGLEELRPYSWKEDDDMINRLEKAISTLRTDRQKKRDAELTAKGISSRT